MIRNVTKSAKNVIYLTDVSSGPANSADDVVGIEQRIARHWRALTKEHIKYDAKQYEKGITGAAAKHTAARQGGKMRQSETGRQSKQVCLQRQRTCSAGTAIMVNN